MSLTDQITVSILKMTESSGNIQFFVRMINNVDKTIRSFNNVLEYSCHQTKRLSKDECMKRAWFDASMVTRFVGHENMDNVLLVNFDEDEEQEIRKNMTIILTFPKKPPTYEYSCKCEDHHIVTEKEHNAIKSGNTYECNTCGDNLKFVE